MHQEFTPEEIIMFPEPMTGTVEETITSDQPGRVWFQNTYWPAQVYNSDEPVSFSPGDRVIVVGRQGLTMLVASLN